MPSWQEPVLHSCLGKGLNDSQHLLWSEWKMLAQPASPVGQKCYPLLLSKYEIYIREGICTGYIWRRIYISVPTGKKDRKYLIKNQPINQPLWMPQIERKGGGECFFPLQRSIGTRVRDYSKVQVSICLISHSDPNECVQQKLKHFPPNPPGKRQLIK